MEDENKAKLMGGHPQAVKVGNMRVVQHKNNEKDKCITPEVTNSALKVDTGVQATPVATVHNLSNIQTAGVQKTHTKPLPCVDPRQHHQPKHDIHQPR